MTLRPQRRIQAGALKIWDASKGSFFVFFPAGAGKLLCFFYSRSGIYSLNLLDPPKEGLYYYQFPQGSFIVALNIMPGYYDRVIR